MNVKIYTEKMFEEIKHIDENGVEFWYARELMTILEYTNWRNFEKLINKSITSLENSNIKVSDHFDVDIKIVEAGISKKTIEDYKLTRYACYILVQNGNPRKKAIALGQQYFAIQTRKQEIAETDFKELSEDDRRLKLREDVRDFNKKLAFEAQNVGVQNFAKFQNSGYQGLYNGETAGDIKKRKNLNNFRKIY